MKKSSSRDAMSCRKGRQEINGTEEGKGRTKDNGVRRVRRISYKKMKQPNEWRYEQRKRVRRIYTKK